MHYAAMDTYILILMAKELKVRNEKMFKTCTVDLSKKHYKGNHSPKTNKKGNAKKQFAFDIIDSYISIENKKFKSRAKLMDGRRKQKKGKK